jgi:hypothetical protein
MLFLIVFASGAVSIVALKRLGLSQLQVTAIPVALLLTYAAVVAFVPWFRLRDDRAGDACYYLGFLFTLVSLASALHEFAQIQRSAETLVADFGIALATTMVGLLLRVLFAQMRADPVEIEREARVALSEATSRLRAELDNSVLELESYRRGTLLSFQDLTTEIAERQRALMGEHIELLGIAVRKAAESMEEASGGFASEARRFNVDAKRLVEGIGRLVSRVDEMASAVRAATTASSEIAGALNQIPEIVSQLRTAEIGRESALATFVDQIKSTIDLLGRSSVVLAASMDGAGDATKALAQLGGAARMLEEALTRLSASHVMNVSDLESGHRQYVEALRSFVSDMQTIVREHNTALRDGLGGQRALVRQLEGGLVGIVDDLTRRIESLPRHPEQQEGS